MTHPGGFQTRHYIFIVQYITGLGISCPKSGVGGLKLSEQWLSGQKNQVLKLNRGSLDVRAVTVRAFFMYSGKFRPIILRPVLQIKKF